MSFLKRVAIAGAFALAGGCGAAFAQEESTGGTYLIMEPDAEVVFITTGGAEVRADWSEAAKENLGNHFNTQIQETGNPTVVFDAEAERSAELEQLLLLFEVVAMSADIPMPHKGGGMQSNYDVTLGDSATILRDTYGSDYAVFINHYSQIESGGVFMTQVLIGAATGYTPPSQNIRATAGTIIDLNTGNLVDRAGAMMGDPRDLEESGNIVLRIMRDLDIEEPAASGSVG